MKKLLIIALLGISTQASAACASLDYEEMKDMSTKELTQTYCKYHRDWQEQLMSNIAYGADTEDRNRANTCKAQVERMSRILRKRDDGIPTMQSTCPGAM